ncbi:hypothetical protein VTK73DRAFT_1025 [Phialemonium thermophilum]|uniref:Uncharacterized protein n=1 Tax=Phialemonium thermophilum TaxID=223376 RepID=A0ABR3VTZ6_9PEZI
MSEDKSAVQDVAAGADSETAEKQKLQLPPSCDPPQPGAPTKQLVWIVFGGTGHMGRSLVRCALNHGDQVTTVGRVFESTPESMVQENENCLGMLCDVRAKESVARVVEKTLERFGRIDCIANCSGYGVIGACEDQDDYEIRNQFETNFMGTLHIIQCSLPYFRQQGAGRYLIFSSTSGALGVPGLGPYCATKYAVEALVEAMLYEIDAFNVKATLVEPGLVRRDDPESATRPLPTWGHFLIKPSSEAYAHATSPALHAKRMVQWLGDRQPTSAVKCAELVWQLGHCAYPPLRLLLGSYAIESIRDRLRSVTEELEDWKHLNFPAAPDVPGADKLEKGEKEETTQVREGEKGEREGASGDREGGEKDDGGGGDKAVNGAKGAAVAEEAMDVDNEEGAGGPGRQDEEMPDSAGPVHQAEFPASTET